MNGKTWLGLALLALSCFQLFIPREVVEQPNYFFHGYALLPGNMLAFSAVMFNLGVIVVGEGICQRFGGASLAGFAFANPARLGKVAIGAAAAGLSLEGIGQWLGKLWVYPYWTTWLYAIVVIPGFVFYWTCIAESYLAVKSVLDRLLPPAAETRGGRRRIYPGALAGTAGAICLGIGMWLHGRWHAGQGGLSVGVVRLAEQTPPLVYGFLLFLGTWLLAEWWLARVGVPSLLGSVRQRYRVPLLAIPATSLPLSLVMETQNLANHYWRYAEPSGLAAALAGVPAWVLVAWPLHYVLFLVVPVLFVPGLGTLFWQRHPAQSAGHETPSR